MAENWSLYVAFSEFLQDEFKDLRSVILPQTEDYRRFRNVVVNLVLATDIASPERTQIGKSKWKEAFGDPFETVERKLQAAQAQAGPGYRQADSPGLQGKTFVFKNHRSSTIAAISTARLDYSGDQSASMSLNLLDDDLMDGSLSGTPDSTEATDDDNARHYAAQIIREVKNLNNNNNTHTPTGKFERRLTSQSTHTSTARYRQRLGILRTVDLSGETLEAYDRRSSHHSARTDCGASMSQSIAPSVYSEPQEEPDDLKQAVVLETIMTAADVAHNLQSWQHMVRQFTVCTAIILKHVSYYFLLFVGVVAGEMGR